MAQGEVIIEQGAVGRIRLDRPQALNALTRSMCEAMSNALLAWSDDAAVKLVIIDHVTERGFCAGGDVRTIAESARTDGGRAARDFFKTEYQMNHLLDVFPKPVVTVMDGVTMGGGVGISLPARYRVATERTLFAMPETTIGLFPDVGGGWWLPRMPGKTGLWLALTGARLKARACMDLGLATHYVPSDRLAELKAQIEAHPDHLDAILSALEEAPPGPELANRAEIDALFSADSLEGIMQALAADGGEFAGQTLAGLSTKSPLSMAMTFRLLNQHPSSFADDLELEYRLAARCTALPDFAEGVRALLIDKDNQPDWQPAPSEDLLDRIFAPMPAGEQWTPHPGLERSRQ